MFSVVATRQDGARRLHRFDVAQTRQRLRKSQCVWKIADMKRPEGGAQAEILVAPQVVLPPLRRCWKLNEPADGLPC